MKLRAQLWLPLPPADVFPFFASAKNLQVITPEWLDFCIRPPVPASVREGTRIDYRLRLHRIPLYWQSEITVWEPPFRFRDEQRRGPYRRWMHTHTFLPHEGGALCLDEVDYAVPGGAWVERLFVRQRLRRIFEFRQWALLRHFTSHTADVVTSTGGPAWQVTIGEAATGWPAGPN
ncbi:MAG TPA: SRPBCC family protein [Opitutaceae bacterium]|nr:SRPBCC family protein [Opitutaceae bacterium]